MPKSPSRPTRLGSDDFDLWLETEHVEERSDYFCNVLVTLRTGQAYALNVWTFAFFDVARHQGEESASSDIAALYMLPPDLFVADLARATAEAVVKDLIERGAVPRDCLVVDDHTEAMDGNAP